MSPYLERIGGRTPQWYSRVATDAAGTSVSAGFEGQGHESRSLGHYRGERMTLFREALVGFRDVGSLLIKKGTVMGSLVPLLFVTFGFVLAAWFFRSVAVISDVPIFSAVFVLAALYPVLSYLRHYAWFAKHDPDRLQSEEYRLLKVQQMIAAKGTAPLIPADSLPLKNPMENTVEPRSPDASEEGPESTDTDEESAS